HSREFLSSSYDGGTAQVFAEAGYEIKASGIGFEPFANLSYANLHLDSFAEEGGTAALSGASSNEDVTFSTLGLRVSKQFVIGSSDVEGRGTLGWQHAYGALSPTSQLAFAGMDTFDVVGLPIARDAAMLEAGFDVRLGAAATIGLSYRGRIASESTDNGFRVDLTSRF